MNIAPLSSGTSSAASVAQTAKRGPLTQEDFMNLFVAQIRNQNPLEPLDNYQMAAQMAQFSSLEALNSMNRSIQNMAAFQASINNLQVAGLIGKKVEAEGNSLSVGGENAIEGYYQLAKPGKVTIKIFDSEGRLVRTIEDGLKDVSREKIVWDGKNQSGASLPEGTYTFQVSAVDEKGRAVSSKSFIVGTLSGITFEDGITYLKLGSTRITISDIRSILG